MNKNNNETFNIYNLEIQKKLLQKYLQKKINKKVKNIFVINLFELLNYKY